MLHFLCTCNIIGKLVYFLTNLSPPLFFLDDDFKKMVSYVAAKGRGVRVKLTPSTKHYYRS